MRTNILSPNFANRSASHERGPETEFPGVRMAKIILLDTNLDQARAGTLPEPSRSEAAPETIEDSRPAEIAVVSSPPNPLISNAVQPAIDLDAVRRTIGQHSSPISEVRLYHDQEAA